MNGTTLVLTYDKALDSASAPVPSNFYVTADGMRVDVDEVSVGGSMVTLTLATAVQAGQTVTLGCAGCALIKDVNDNPAVSFTAWLVTNNTDGGGGEPPGGGDAPPDVTAAAAHASDGEWHHAGPHLQRDARRHVDTSPGRLRRDRGGEYHHCEPGERRRVGGDADAGQCCAGRPGGDAGLHAGGEPDPGRGGQRRGTALRAGRDQQHQWWRWRWGWRWWRRWRWWWRRQWWRRRQWRRRRRQWWRWWPAGNPAGRARVAGGHRGRRRGLPRVDGGDRQWRYRRRTRRGSGGGGGPTATPTPARPGRWRPPRATARSSSSGRRRQTTAALPSPATSTATRWATGCPRTRRGSPPG